MSRAAYDEELKTALDISYLLSCAVNEKKPDPARVSKMDLQTVQQAARRHSVSSIVCFALENAGILLPELKVYKSKALRKLAVFESERAKILQRFEECKIWYLPLKGIVLKNYYPEFGMREMSDNDILCDGERMDDVRIVMESLGYIYEKHKNISHDEYTKAPIMNFEIHRTLFEKSYSETFFDYYSDVKCRLIQDKEHPYEYRFSDEDLYIYLLSHEYKHYENAGTGLRSLLDTYVFLKKNSENLNWDYIWTELEKIGLTEFEKTNREISVDLFSGNQLPKNEEETLMYIYSCGTYGTFSIKINNKLSKKAVGKSPVSAKLEYVKERVFLPDVDLKRLYPFFYEHKLLVPLLYIYRPIRGVIIHPKKIIEEIKTVKRFNKHDHNI